MNDQLCSSLGLRARAANGVNSWPFCTFWPFCAGPANVVCARLMMRSFSLNENFAWLAGQGRWILCWRQPRQRCSDTLIYWQDASWIFNCVSSRGGGEIQARLQSNQRKDSHSPSCGWAYANGTTRLLAPTIYASCQYIWQHCNSSVQRPRPFPDTSEKVN